ncbi:acyltransferase family protein [Deinococcus yavapaiensis]|uniref:Peptidoglycan/LPS O-acetylase OafA/YrhL n=1 Tax=Deinococcus yavapaiensis KR-236 TaxID=694435 RepID=A0A318SRI4_9DEIO|nr:acyltransferase family protein [Deinococcus yavapaiensis]PYE55687.1 peptidoglycan/LPS O-acetylase OafA/YrhL [Deinococcus yavapaiensis KR-236]
MERPANVLPARPLRAAERQADGPEIERLEAVDVTRGLAIVAVVVHHVSGLALPLAAPGVAHTALAVLNRSLLFVVPTFLLVTALVLTRSALHAFDARRYYAARARTALGPYLVWTVLYVLFRVATRQDAPDVLLDAKRWWIWLRYGKGYFHLYFLLIALQFYLVLPLALPLARKRPSLRVTLGVALAVQLAVFALNRQVLHLRFPGTMVAWYLPALALGVALGAQNVDVAAWWRRTWRPVSLAALVTFLWFVPLAVTLLDGERVGTLAYAAANTAYTVSAALVVFGLSHALVKTRGGRALSFLGTVSLQVYLLHPALLTLLKAHLPTGGTTLAGAAIGLAIVALGVPVLVAWMLRGTLLSRVLFGR